ncbi:Pogo transposable element with KRAB domain [Acropora cervicornis]|uniref:Pogo transposable element with KRAB domain n=1 Tax=Acropora cervicornis TaxID=6130 RepID=A0AAD9PU54_ACRCE|nr:Pogo transposable element with KRAB domain [Acropora cervicornis]
MAKARNVAESEFIASVHWCHRFMDRHDLSICRRTTISQKLPENFEDKLLKFQRFITTEQKKHENDLSLIGNADQTPLTFDMPANSTVDAKGTKSVSIMTTGHEKDRFTVMLACLGDGAKLPPYVVFKQKTLPKDLVLPWGIHVRAQAKGWMDESLVKDWRASTKKKSPCVGLF